MRTWSFSLIDLLNDVTGVREFERFLRSEFSDENIKFWLSVERLRHAPETEVDDLVLDIYK